MSDNVVKNVQDTIIALMLELHKDPNFSEHKYMDEFMALDSDVKKVDFMYNLLQKFNLVKFCKGEKNDAKAINYREEGNEAFYNRQYRHALSNYNLSVFNAESNEVLALAYANRSAALHKLELFNECLLDIERALLHGYPEKSKIKLLQRAENVRSKLEPFRFYQNPPTISAEQRNAQIQCATKSVRIERGHLKYGNHIVATRNINIGEVLLVEEAFAASFDVPFECRDDINFNHFCRKYCKHCGALSFAPIPCKNCTQAFYCNIICRDAAFLKVHKYECSILATLELFLEGTNPEKLLAIRMTLGLGNACNEDLDKFKNSDRLYRSDRYNEVFNLSTNADRISPSEYISTTTVAAYVFHLIEKYTDFFNDNPAAKNNFKHLLNVNLLICDANAFDLTLCSMVPLDPLGSPEKFAVGLYPFASLLNHSCKMNVFRIFHGNTVVCRAIDVIKRGEQCFISYSGVTYLSLSKLERQTLLLRTAHFTCPCEACEEDLEIVEFVCHYHLRKNAHRMSEEILQSLMEPDGHMDVKNVGRVIQQFTDEMKKGDCHKHPYCSEYTHYQWLLLRLYEILGNRDAMKEIRAWWSLQGVSF